MEQNTDTYHVTLHKRMDEYVHESYRLTKKFPKDEIFGSVSQLRRSALSVILNYIEGYARQRDKVYKNFLETSYGSLKESKYLIQFAFDEKYIAVDEYKHVVSLSDEIGRMLWGILRKMEH